MNQHAAQKILAALRIADESPCSGEALSARLGVSRAQIWKHVSQLRRRGYQIEGAPGGGYRLTHAAREHNEGRQAMEYYCPS